MPRWFAWSFRIVVLVVAGGFVLVTLFSGGVADLRIARFVLIPVVLAVAIVWTLTENGARGQDHT